MYIIMLIGAPASGKTTCRHQLIKVAEERGMTAITVCKDDIREELFGNRADNSHNKEVYFEASRRMISCIKNRKCDVLILDSCHPKRKTRLDIMRAIKPNITKDDITCAVYFRYREEELVKRNNTRANIDERVPTAVVQGLYRCLETVSSTEGFDKYICISDDVAFNVSDILNKSKDTQPERRYIAFAANGV